MPCHIIKAIIYINKSTKNTKIKQSLNSPLREVNGLYAIKTKTRRTVNINIAERQINFIIKTKKCVDKKHQMTAAEIRNRKAITLVTSVSLKM